MGRLVVKAGGRGDQLVQKKKNLQGGREGRPGKGQRKSDVNDGHPYFTLSSAGVEELAQRYVPNQGGNIERGGGLVRQATVWLV